jgi:hypothetical protein
MALPPNDSLGPRRRIWTVWRDLVDATFLSIHGVAPPWARIQHGNPAVLRLFGLCDSAVCLGIECIPSYLTISNLKVSRFDEIGRHGYALSWYDVVGVHQHFRIGAGI